MTGCRWTDGQMAPPGGVFGVLEIEPAFFKNIEVGETICVQKSGLVIKITGEATRMSAVGCASCSSVVITRTIAGTDYHWAAIMGSELVKREDKSIEIHIQLVSKGELLVPTHQYFLPADHQ